MIKNVLRCLSVSFVCVLLMTFTACVDQSAAIPDLGEDTGLDEWIDMIPDVDGSFVLTVDERELYDEYIRTGNISVLYGAGPVSVIKLSIQAAIDGHFEHEFNLFHPDTLGGLTLEDHLPPPDAPSEFAGSPEFRQRIANVFFWQIDQGEFEQDGERACVSFYTGTGESMTLAARLNESGIWLVEHWS